VFHDAREAPRLCRLGFMLLLLGLFTFVCRPLLLLILPGILVIYLPWWRQAFPLRLAGVGDWNLDSLLDCYLWFLPYGKISLSSWAYGVLVLATVLMGMGLWKWPGGSGRR
jgi:hypothetical protein